MLFDNLHLDSPSAQKITASHGDFVLGPGGANLRPKGEDIHVSGAAGKATPNPCNGKFVPLPR